MHGDTRPKRTDSFKSKDLGDEVVIYDPKGDVVHVLNETAREIFLLVDGRRSVEDVVRVVLDRYEVDEATARKDVDGVLRQLVDLGLLSPS